MVIAITTARSESQVNAGLYPEGWKSNFRFYKNDLQVRTKLGNIEANGECAILLTQALIFIVKAIVCFYMAKEFIKLFF